jgi:hypothetical protein
MKETGKGKFRSNSFILGTDGRQSPAIIVPNTDSRGVPVTYNKMPSDLK